MFFSRKRDLKGKAKIWAVAIAGVALVVGGFVLITAMVNSLRSNAEAVLDGMRVQEDSELTYYLKVKYDGVDRQGVESSDSVTSEVRSGVIDVSDQIPDGLIFQHFVESDDGSFGAVERGNPNVACAGTLIDDTGDTTGWNAGNTEFVYHGLHYNASTRKVTFRVRNLKAGCQLEVGIVTRTPTLGENELRRDFYNHANVLEGSLGNISNTVHTWIGRDVATYKVIYSYTGEVPDGAPAAPAEMQFAEGSINSLEAAPEVNGYQFSGWTTSDVEVVSGQYVMPSQEIHFVGSFTEKPKYTVHYAISGDAPASYEAPLDKDYGEGDTVEVDSYFSAGSVLDGYTFSGWSTSDATISGGAFTMPADDVTLTGSFTRIKYKVKYQFIGTVAPANASSLLPAQAEYYPGEEVTIAPKPTAEGYQFSGWYGKSGDFTMGESDVTLTGEWSVLGSYFQPTITHIIENPKTKYVFGNTVEFKITITNTASFPISNVVVGLELEGAKFVPLRSYTIQSDQMAVIPTLAAGASQDLSAEFTIPTNDDVDYTSVAVLMGATAENNNRMDTSDEASASYRAPVSFSSERIVAPPPMTGATLKNLLPFIIIAVVGIAGATTAFVIKKKKANK